FCVSIRRPPGSPLFPYPTLFRSQQVVALAGGDGPPPGRHTQAALDDEEDLRRGGVIVRPGPVGVPGHSGTAGAQRPPAAPVGQEDRKSTRLNSSHVKISYAVFCL